MKPSSRIQAGIEILERGYASRVPMDAVVGDYMRQRRYIGSKDRSEIAERAYNMMRHYARLNWWLSHIGAEDTPRGRMIVWLALGEGCDEKRLQDLFDGSKYSPEELSADEFNLINTPPLTPPQAGGEPTEERQGGRLHHPDMPEHVAVECPPQHYDTLRKLYGDHFKAEMEAMLSPATLDLRVNTFLCDKENVQKSLAKDGIETMETPLSPVGLRCKEKAFISKSKAWNKGWISIQDEGSQMIAQVTGAKPGMQVLDFCAGGGGKTLALAAMMNRKGRIVAMDNDTRRLNKGRDRYKKAQLADIIEVRSLEDEKNRKWLRRQKEKFDVVLLDVPCSGTGTWRRNPDMRWREYGPSLEEILSVQAEIMDKVAGVVKPGGRLVYATCSLLPQENEEQVEAFLKRHEGFKVVNVNVILNEAAAQSKDLEHRQGDSSATPGTTNQGYMRLTPYKNQTDGFFAAVLERV